MVRVGRIAVQTIVIGAAISIGIASIAISLIAGDCAGWMNTGTCPRDPFWDWETFSITFWGSALAVAVTRFVPKPGWKRLRRAVIEAVVAAALLGVLVVLVTAV